MAARITITEPDGQSRSFVLEQGTSLTMGRGTDCDIIVADREMSRRHCVFMATNDCYTVCDLESPNGIIKDGARVDSVELAHGDELSIGGTKVSFEMTWMGRGTVVAAPRGRAGRVVLLVLLSAGVFAGAVLAGSYATGQLRRLIVHTRARPITVTTIPEAAMVFIDGQYVGVTPLSGVSLLPGPHAIRITKADYQTWTKAVGVDSEPILLENIQLAATAIGSAFFETDPSEAEVYLDGEKAGVTPFRLDSLPVGEYDVRLQKPGYVPHLARLVIRSGQEAHIRQTLEVRQAEVYLALLEKDPKNCSYHAELAHVYLLERRIDKALEHLRTALEITANGADTSGYTARLQQLFQKIYGNQAFRWGTDAELARVRDNIDSMVLDLMAKYPNARFLWDWQVGFLPAAGTQLNSDLLRKYIKVNATAGVIASIDTATKYAQQKQFDTAADILKMAIEEQPGRFDLHLALGQVYFDMAKAGDKTLIEPAVQQFTTARPLTQEEAQLARIDLYLKRLADMADANQDQP